MNIFEKHQGFLRTFKENKLTLGIFFPLEAYEGSMPVMNLEKQMDLAVQAEEANFTSLFVRDIPLNDPYFGDAGQIYDPWIFLSYVAACTDNIALGTGSIITTFRHPLDLAKSASSLDRISNERLLFGVATGDRPIEFTAYRVDRKARSDLFQESFHVMKTAWKKSYPPINSNRVQLHGVDLLPKPTLTDIPTLITGYAGQTLKWIAENGDGWISFPRNPIEQGMLIKEWRSQTTMFKPFSQSLYIDLAVDPYEDPTPIHLGFRSGSKYLAEHLHQLQTVGVNHVILNVKFAERPIADIIQELGEEVVPYFPAL